MDSGQALRIFENIESGQYTETEKGQAVATVMKFPTHNSLTKAGLLRVMRWILSSSCIPEEWKVV